MEKYTKVITKPKKIKEVQPAILRQTTLEKAGATCTIINGDSRVELPAYKGMADLIVTSPPYADARHKHYDGIHPDKFVEWFLTFNESFYNALKPEGSLVINIKDKVVDGVRHRYVWQTQCQDIGLLDYEMAGNIVSILLNQNGLFLIQTE